MVRDDLRELDRGELTKARLTLARERLERRELIRTRGLHVGEQMLLLQAQAHPGERGKEDVGLGVGEAFEDLARLGERCGAVAGVFAETREHTLLLSHEECQAGKFPGERTSVERIRAAMHRVRGPAPVPRSLVAASGGSHVHD